MIDRGTGRTGHDLFLGHAYESLKQSPNLAVRCPSTAMAAGITAPDRNGFLARFRTPAGGICSNSIHITGEGDGS